MDLKKIRIIGKKCKKLMNNLPKNIKTTFEGQVQHDKVQNYFSKYDLFIFPTRGENFGHVILSHYVQELLYL